MAMTSNLFAEPKKGFIAHSATSALFVTNPSYHDWAGHLCEVSIPAASKLVEATEKWPGTTDRTETSYNLAFDTRLPFFEHMATQPHRTKQFASYMKHVTNSSGMAIEHLVNGFDWASLGKATVVDVGGSSGNACISLAKQFPDLNFVVQDLAENTSDGEATIGDYGPDIASRIKFQSHDFFQEQPVKGADVYLLRMILHDWPDKEAIQISKSLARAMSSSSRILIMDSVMPIPGSIPSSLERNIRAKDIAMWMAFNSMERDLGDWEELLENIDDRLQIANVVQPVSSFMSVLEVVCKS